MQKKSSLGHSFTSLARRKTNHPCLQLYPRFGVISSFFTALARLQAAGLFVEVPYFKVRKDYELSSRNPPNGSCKHSWYFLFANSNGRKRQRQKRSSSRIMAFGGGKLDVSTSGVHFICWRNLPHFFVASFMNLLTWCQAKPDGFLHHHEINSQKSTVILLKHRGVFLNGIFQPFCQSASLEKTICYSFFKQVT